MIRVLVLAALAIQDPRPADEPIVVDERPASTQQPKVPGIDIEGDTSAPEEGRIARNGTLADRFTAEGQATTYHFESRAGELSIFELGTWGYARGWASTASMRILDAEANELEAVLRPGGTVYRKFLCFTAPKEGAYRLVLGAAKEHYRYTLVRHSDYVARKKGALLAFGDRDELHGYLATPEDEVTYAIDLAAGDEVAFKALNTQEQARKQKRTQLARGAGGRMMEGMTGRDEGRMREAMRGGRMRGGGASDYPDFALRVSHAGETLREGSHYALFRAPAAGRYLVTVLATNEGEGGLFDLSLTRAPEKATVTGYVGDADDDPVAGVTVRFLREPDFDPVGETKTTDEGTYEIDVPLGAYTLVLRGDGGGVETLRTAVESDREINAVFVKR